ncbi:SNF2-related protein [Arthrobacter sp. JSM 101049]|uniref:DEAD/DEAH box helicase n=1 Tax=Arthrobacter sp. JSM 101049 TaxID=929097 RepID=UPI003563F04C
MADSEFPLVDAREILRVVGGAAFTRGKGYANAEHVLDLAFEPSETMLSARVVGSSAEPYETTVLLAGRPGAWTVGETWCSCAVGIDCKHAAAVLILSNTLHLRAQQVFFENTRVPAKVPAWQESLDALLGAGQQPATATTATAGHGSRGAAERQHVQPMALQFELQDTTQVAHRQWAPGSGVGHQRSSGHRWRLGVRPMVRSGNGRWIRGNLRWNTISFKTYGLNLDPEQHRWFCQFVPLYRANGQLYFGEDNDWLYLDEFSSPLLWSLLAETAALGIRLIGPQTSTEIRLADTASVGLTAARAADDGGALGLVPTLTLEGGDLALGPETPVGAIGTHGVYAARADGGLVVLAPVPQRLGPAEVALLHRPAEVVVPAEDVEDFLATVYPRLGRRVAISALDDSVELPPILPPTLVLSVDYPGGDAVELSWEMDYGHGPLEADLRDTEAEDALEEAALAALADSPALAGRALVPRTLHGLDTVDFVRRSLPLLEAVEGVRIHTTGTAPEYRELTEAPELTVTTVESEKRDWFDLGLVIAIGDRRIPFADVLRALSRGQNRMLMPDKTYFSLEHPLFDKLRELVAEAGALNDKNADLQITRYQASLWEELEELATVVEGPDSWFAGVNSLLNVAEADPPALPAGLKATFRPYQREGFEWLAMLWRNELGGVLADDMGLGKTVQTLALVLHAKEQWAAALPDSSDPVGADPAGAGPAGAQPGPGRAAGAPASSSTAVPGPFLVVAPTSVVGNWADEAARFAPGLTVEAISDTQGRAARPLSAIAAENDVVVTSYTLFRLDAEAYQSQTWAGLILDEAQFVKNKATKAHHAARDLNAAFKLAITGTPMENNLMELWSIFAIVSPGLFPSALRYAENYQRPIEKQGLEEPLVRLRKRIRPFMLRRTKDAVVTDLPPKQEQVLNVELAPRHRKIYDTHLQRERQKILRLVDDMDKNRFTIFQSLTLLRMLSLDASLVDPEYDGVASAKLDVLFEQLADVLSEGHRALVFSQFTSFLKKAAARLEAEGVDYAYLDGSTRRRAEVIDSFKSGKAPVFLISLKAGGFGLNLTEADYCFLLDPWWNPAAESQAVDRVHRIGQTRNVMVYRMVAKDTIEEKVVALQDAKRELISSVMDAGEGFGSAMTADDIRNLLIE